MIVEKELGISADYQYKAYNSKNFLQRNWHRNKLDSINIFLSYLYNVEDMVVLDLGTGSGNFELVMNSKFKKIYGFDYNEEAVDFLNKKIEQNKIKNVETKVIDITKIDLKEIPPKIDIVVMMDVIEHINYAEAGNLIKILENNLNDDGKIIVVTPNYYSPWFLIEKILDKLTIVPKFDGAQHIAKYNFESLDKFFEKENYEKVFTTSINTLSFLFPNHYLCSLINKLEFFSSFKYGNLLVGIYQKKTN
jgi:2-polyprenyl-3-methyl-5-hydroxy-6-metoxy-1,4-benzoquinol methylase